jgi:hypothetical protein
MNVDPPALVRISLFGVDIECVDSWSAEEASTTILVAFLIRVRDYRQLRSPLCRLI